MKKDPELEAFDIPEPDPEPDNKLERLQERLTHARAMHRKALTRVKRAQTIERKWKRRERALERRAKERCL